MASSKYYLIVYVMTIANSDVSLALEPIPSTYSIYKRLANLVLAVIAVAISINLWILGAEQANDWHQKQANQLGRSISQLSAETLSSALPAKDMDEVKRLLMAISDDPHVLTAAVFNDKGQILDSTNASVSLLATYQLSSEKPLVFIEEIASKGKIYGYLRVLLDEREVMRFHGDYQTQLIQQQLILMLLGCAGGVLLARAFYKFRLRYYQSYERQKAG